MPAKKYSVQAIQFRSAIQAFIRPIHHFLKQSTQQRQRGLLSLLLTLCGYIPGIVHAVYIIAKR
ncbi:YqaE/Pmp3 family membrane protein [Pseudomonas sp. PCH199]|nr:YqaE/Pmp3 family membrane protein [Pseudomonas sp. PCH199]PAM85482.1 hypothetical protein CES87_03190 [Pseudomonas sp. ERMR1:02]